MAPDGQCPRCGGVLHPIFIGAQRDKFLKCAHCDYQIDVPDEEVFEEIEEQTTPGGYSRKVQRTIKRMGGDENVDFDPKAIFEAAIAGNIQMGIQTIHADNMEDAITKVRESMGDDMAKQLEKTMLSVQTSEINTRHQRTETAGYQGKMDGLEAQVKANKAGNGSNMWLFVGAGLGIALCAMIAALVLVALLFAG